MTITVFNLYQSTDTLASFSFLRPSQLAKAMAQDTFRALEGGEAVELETVQGVLRSILSNSGFSYATIDATVDLFNTEVETLQAFPHWADGGRPEISVPCRQAALERFPAEPEAAPF